MAHMATDGKKFTNRPPMMAHNRSLERQHEPTDQPGMSEAGGEEMDGSEVAREHGPAVEVNLMHDHEGGRHSVHSRHPDGHEHMSEHDSAEAAHEHGKKLAMGHEEPDADDMEPEYE